MNEVRLRPVVDVPPALGLNEREAVIAPGIEFSPPGLKFSSPIKVTVPHCATFSDPSRAKIKFYTRDTGKIFKFYKQQISSAMANINEAPVNYFNFKLCLPQDALVNYFPTLPWYYPAFYFKQVIYHSMSIVGTGIYTERQKKLITSSGRRSLKSTASKLIIFGHK